ncbi:putative gp33-like protein [Esparto virus]|uniref:Putative gp33-like protein n=1 Tax=Esparto virus TaxID=2072209 RepID=A0A2I7G2Z1_9VIRU|nr:putative gp33-like protein [Esparto virus]AUQ43986.1 putative gp33-like protein [Esparto virus]
MMLKCKNLPSICVFIYNVHNDVSCTLAKDVDSDTSVLTLDTLTPLCNMNAIMNGYLVDEQLYALSQLKLNIKLSDFGITILMMHFAEFYARGQYPLFMNMFRCVKELEVLERFLLSYNQRSIRLPTNLASDKLYGLRAQKDKFIKFGGLTLETFHNINMLMRINCIKPQQFIDAISPLHITIIESFYIFTSITKNCKVINECHDLQHNNMSYTFKKPIKSLKYDGDYWFELPHKAIWFAYYQGRVKYSAYVSCDIDEKLKSFNLANILFRIVGFVHENCLYPLIIEDPKLYAQWDLTINYLQQYNLNCIFRPNTYPMPIKKTRIHFVKQSVAALFKLEI